MTQIEIGRLLRAGTQGFMVGCRVNQLDAPSFGAMVRAPLDDGSSVYGLIHDIHIDDDGLVRQLVTADQVDEAVIADNRINRNVPIEVGVLTIGYQKENRFSHLLPPRPPLSLDRIYLCDAPEVLDFTRAGRFGYFRHILRARDLPRGDLLAAHLSQANAAHESAGNPVWVEAAMSELIVLLRDDYATLMEIMGALGELSN